MGAIVLSACNMAEVAIPAHVLGGRLRNRNAVINWAFAQKFLIYAVVLGPAFAGSLAGVALSSLKSENSGEIFRMWFMADALGIALVTPIAVALRRSGIGAMRDKEGLAYMILCLGLVGVVTAAVRIVPTLDQAASLKAGEILVTRFTDPGWTPVLGLVSGIVTEVGGLLSHAAVIGREYGIPAVLNVARATHVLRTGQVVEIDGSEGTVRILSAAE